MLDFPPMPGLQVLLPGIPVIDNHNRLSLIDQKFDRIYKSGLFFKKLLSRKQISGHATGNSTGRAATYRYYAALQISTAPVFPRWFPRRHSIAGMDEP
jgi:hypothetical protein